MNYKIEEDEYKRTTRLWKIGLSKIPLLIGTYPWLYYGRQGAFIKAQKERRRNQNEDENDPGWSIHSDKIR